MLRFIANENSGENSGEVRQGPFGGCFPLLLPASMSENYGTDARILSEVRQFVVVYGGC